MFIVITIIIIFAMHQTRQLGRFAYKVGRRPISTCHRREHVLRRSILFSHKFVPAATDSDEVMMTKCCVYARLSDAGTPTACWDFTSGRLSPGRHICRVVSPSSHTELSLSPVVNRRRCLLGRRRVLSNNGWPLV